MSSNPAPSTSANPFNFPTPHQNIDFSQMREPTRTIDSSPESNFTELSDISLHRDEPPHLRHDYAKGRSPDMMPGPGEKAAPTRFKGDFDLVKQFIRKYNRLCAAYNLVDPQEKCERLVDYCSRSVRLFIESLPSYQRGQWAQLEKDVLKYYDADLDETRYIPDQLAELAEEWQHIKITDLATWKEYQREFLTKAGWLRSKDTVTKEMEAGYFWQGIHRKFRQDIEIRLFATNPTLTPKRAYPIDLVSSIAEGLLERNRFEYSLMGVNTERPDWYTQTDSDDSDDDSTDSDRRRKSKRHREHRKSRSRSSRKDDSDSEVENKKKNRSSRSRKNGRHSKSYKDTESQEEVEQLITQMSKMDISDPGYAVVYYKAIKLDPMVVDIISPPGFNHPPTRRPHARVSFADQPQSFNYSAPRPPTPVNVRPPTLTGGNAEPMKCYVCGELGHTIRGCPKATELFRAGTIIRNGNGKIALRDGTVLSFGPHDPLVDVLKRRQQPLQSHFVALDSEEYVSEDYMDDYDFDESYPVQSSAVYPAQRVEKKTTSTRRQSIEEPTASPHVNKDNTPSMNTRSRPPSINQSRTQTTFRPANLPVVKPIDVRTPRVRPTANEDTVMKDLTQTESSPTVLKPAPQDSPRQKTQPRQSELSLQTDIQKMIREVLDITVHVPLSKLLGASKELSDAFSEQLKRRNPKSGTGSNLVTPPMENLPNQELSRSKPKISPIRNQARPSITQNSKIHLIGSSTSVAPPSLPVQVHLQNSNATAAGNLIYTQWSCDGSTIPIESIIDTGSQLNIINADLVPDFIRSPIEPDTVRQIIVASSGAKELKGLIRGVRLRNGDIETIADFYIGENVPFQALLGRPWQVENQVSIEQRETGAYLVFPTQGRPGRKLELPTATRPARIETSLLASMTPFPYQEDPYDSLFDSDTESEAEDDLENSETLPEAYTLNVQAYDEDSGKIDRLLTSENQDNNDIRYSNNHRLLYPSQNYSDSMEVDLENCRPHGTPQKWEISLKESVELFHKVVLWCNPVLVLILTVAFAIPSLPQLVYAIARLLTKLLEFIGNYFVYIRGRNSKISSFYTSHSKPSHKSRTTSSLDQIDMPDLPVVLYTGSLHAVPGHEDYPMIDPTIDTPSSEALTRLAATITDWPPTPNHLVRYWNPSSLPSMRTSFRDAHYHAQLIDEAAQAYTNRPLDDRVISIMSSNNTIELSSMGMDSLLVQQGVMLNASIVSQTLRNEYRAPIQRGHLFYTFVTPRMEHPSEGVQHAANPVATRLGIGSPRLRVPRPIIIEDSDDDEVPDSQEEINLSQWPIFDIPVDRLIHGELPDYAAILSKKNDKQDNDNDGASIADSTAAVYSPTRPGSRRDSTSSDMSIELDDDPREPRIHDARPPTAIEERFLNSIFSTSTIASQPFGLPLSASQYAEPVVTPVNVDSTHSLPSLESVEHLEESDSSQVSTSPLNLPPKRLQEIREQAYNFLGRKITPSHEIEPTTNATVNPALISQPSPRNLIKVNRMDKDYDPKDCLHPPHGSLVCLRHNLTHAQHYALQESGLTLNEVDNMNEYELDEYLRTLNMETPSQPQEQPPPLPRLTEEELSEYAAALDAALDSPSSDSETLGSQSSVMSPDIAPAQSGNERTHTTDTTVQTDEPVKVMTLFLNHNVPRIVVNEFRDSKALPRLHDLYNHDNDSTSSSSFELILHPPTEAALRGTQIADGTYRTSTPYPTPERELEPTKSNTDWTNLKYPAFLTKTADDSENDKSSQDYMSMDESDYSPDAVDSPSSSTDPSDESQEDATVKDDESIILLHPPIQVQARLHETFDTPIIDYHHPPNLPPNRNIIPTSIFATTQQIYPGELMYELATDAPDPWDYNGAETTVIRRMSNPPSYTKEQAKYTAEPPENHPYWLDNHADFKRIRTTVKYQGTYDNHPLRNWHNRFEAPTDYHDYWKDDGDTDIAQYVVDICEASRQGILLPEAWHDIDGPPEYIVKAQDAVRHVYRNLRGHLHELDECELCSANHDEEPLESVEGNRLLFFNVNVLPKNYGQLAPYDYYVEHYKNPWASDNHVIAFNPWNVKIIYLRRIRIDILQFFRELIYYVFTPEFRRFIDSPQAPSDMRHYFYHHCAFFRFLDYHIPLLFQGFSCECIHPEVGSSHTWTERQPNPPRNPLLTAEEDEFLHHISEYFEYQEVIRMANTCRHLREISYFLSSHVRSLFVHGYLDPDYIFDGQNNRRAIMWCRDSLAAY
ncbi:hypothetical protein PLEOSDRAFT_1104996 [Pleurotus ostreatus PC15]|uniref:CCHC-type domain-containing protein n=1 Tax=Pleurotus ostreatus (strain PC15) TaxID=1137138 RepID=A0A067NMX8_PLEO1|nr:hypothetical protein PLEOSDRAFT_1104996 [Pleurotus ostreatus PC15]